MTTPSAREAIQEKSSLLGFDEAPPYSRIAPSNDSSILLVCDHASPLVPASLRNLGLSEDALRRHIAWDRGALELSHDIRKQLNCALIAASYSRLVIDVNRAAGHPQSIIEMSEDTAIPSNVALSASDARQRHDEIFKPYHAAVTDTLSEISAHHGRGDVISIHSFTPQYLGELRPWEFGILWNQDDRVARPLIHGLRDHGFVVGDNEPYSGRDPAGYTIRTHGEDNGYPHVLIEVRDDLIEDSSGIARISRILSEQLNNILGRL